MFTDGREGRTAARCGVGAVQGSKNLKAVVVRGTGDVPLHDAAGLDASLKALLSDFARLRPPGSGILYSRVGARLRTERPFPVRTGGLAVGKQDR